MGSTRSALAVGAACTAVVATMLGGAAVLRTADADRQELLAPAQAPSIGADVRARADEVYGSFAGTIEQRNAGEVMRAWALNGAMDVCMEAEGFPEWDALQSRTYAGEEDPLFYSIWLAEPMRPVTSDGLITLRQALVTEREMYDEEIPADEAEAVDRCSDATPARPLSATEAGAPATPPAARHLLNAWNSMVVEADIAASEQAGAYGLHYARCMDEADIPFLDRDEVPFGDVGPALDEIKPAVADIPSSPSDPRVSQRPWQEFLAQERTLTDADWACRQDVYADRIDELLPRIDEFAAGHQQQIAAARAGWERVVERAEELEAQR